MRILVAVSLAAAVALAPGAASPHEVLHQIERGRAIAVRAYESDGEALAGAAYQVYSPADPRTPFLEGKTDRSGWVAFVPDAPGRWRVKVLDETGHGLDLEVDASAPAGASTRSGAAIPSAAAFVLRPIAGVAAIGALFGLLFLLYRRKGAPR